MTEEKKLPAMDRLIELQERLIQRKTTWLEAVENTEIMPIESLLFLVGTELAICMELVVQEIIALRREFETHEQELEQNRKAFEDTIQDGVGYS